MRILIHLSSKQDAQYDNDYHYHLQSVFYRLMLESGRNDVHSREGYKHFCFSNIFPYGEKFVKNKEYNLIFSSPGSDLCRDVFLALEARIKAGGEASILRIGSLGFEIAEVSRPFTLDIETNSPIKVRSATPIIVRIPKWRYADYGIESDRPFEFWRESISLEAFVKQVRDGIEKKLLETKGEGSKEKPPVPEVISFRYVKSVSKPITIKGEKQQAIGSLWEFEFSPQSQEERRSLEFALDSGLGERNSLGFGFMNAI